MNELKKKGTKVCPICRGEQFSQIYTHQATGLPLIRCTDCGLIFFLFSRVDKAWDYWKTGGSKHNIEVYSNPAVIKQAKKTYSRYLNWLKAEIGVGSLIDYGCGVGTFIEFARSRGWEAYGLDTSGPAVKHARAKGLPVWTLDDWKKMDSPPLEKAETVTLLNVIEHVREPRETIQFTYSLLKDGGLLLIETPSANYIFKRLSLWLSRVSRGKIDLARFFFYPDHRFYFTQSTLAKLLKDCGFNILWVRKTTTSVAKIMCKLHRVHQVGRPTRALAWFALQATRLLGGNKILVCACKEPVESQESRVYRTLDSGLFLWLTIWAHDSNIIEAAGYKRFWT